MKDESIGILFLKVQLEKFPMRKIVYKMESYVIIAIMERNNFSTKTEEELMVPRIIRMAKLLNRYFLVYFLYRDAQKCTGKGYLTYKDDETSRQLYNKYYKEVKNRKSQIESVSSEGRNKIESEVFKVLKNYINDDCTEFDIVRFVKEEKAYFNLLPEEIRGVDEGVLSSMAEDARKNNEYVSFVKICLEKLFDSKFRDEFNKKTENFLFREEKRCRDENKLPDFYKFDMVRDFLKVFSTSYSFIFNDSASDVPYWSFPDYNKEIGQRNNGGRKEKVDNLYSGFKLYGHGEYSKLLIAYRSKVKSKSSFDLIELRNLGLRPIVEDDELVEINFNDGTIKISIKSTVDKFKSQNEEFQSRIKRELVSTEKTLSVIENDVDKIFEIDKLLHRRFKGNYIPQELDGMYNSSDPQKTLREEIVESLLKRSKKNHTDNDDDVWTADQCSKIKDWFVEKVIKNHTQEECLRKSNNDLFKNYDYKDLSSKKYLSKRYNITTSDLFDVLMDFDDEIKDDRTGGRLQAWEEIKNAYSLNTISLDTPVGEDEEETLYDFIEDENIQERYEKIDYWTEIYDFVVKEIKKRFKESPSFENFLKNYLDKSNREQNYLVFSSNDKLDRTDVLYRAVKGVLDNKSANIIRRAIEEKKDKKIFISRYDNESPIDYVILRLEKILNINPKSLVAEKIWLMVFFESLRGNHSWRQLVAIYISRLSLYSDNERKFAENYVKQSMQMIYDEIVNFEEKEDDKKQGI